LEEFSTTLKFLSYSICLYGNEPYKLHPFPTLPKLENLQLRVTSEFGRRCGVPSIIYLDTATSFNDIALPALKSVDVPFGVFLRVGSCNLQSVTSVTLQIQGRTVAIGTTYPNFGTEGWSLNFCRDFIRNIFLVFPNTAKICLEPFGADFDSNMRLVIREMIHSPSTASIQEFEISNYEEDYLGEVLRGIDQPPQTVITLKNFPGTKLSTAVHSTIKKLFGELGMGAETLEIAEDKQVLPHVQTMTVELKLADGQSHELNYMTNVKIIRLLKTDNTTDRFLLDSENVDLLISKNQRILHLSAIGKHMPNVRIFEVSTNILSSTGIPFAYEKVRDIEKGLPNWSVNLL